MSSPLIVANGLEEQTPLENYINILSEIKREKERIKEEYINADSLEQKTIIQTAEKYVLDKLVNNIFPAWYGTKWDFNGTTNLPKQGSIACGYFVTRTIEAVGFNIPTHKWAQEPSSYMITKMSSESEKEFTSGLSLSEFKKRIEKKGEGLYVVGLDCHVGFLYYQKNEMKLIHSNYYNPPSAVVSEAIDTNNPLRNSNIRYLGEICGPEMMKKWILDEKLE